MYPAPTTRRNAACLELHRKSQLKSWSPAIWNSACTAHSQQTSLEIPLKTVHGELTNQDYSTSLVPDSLKPYISSFTNSPPGCHIPRKARVQHNRLRTRHGRFNAYLYRMGSADNKNCVCGSNPPGTSSITVPVLAPPCSVINTTNWCWPICCQHEIKWACAAQICVNASRCRLNTTSCMIAPNSNLRATSYGGQPCSFGMPYPIKVLTNLYSCSCIGKKNHLRRPD